MLPYKSNIEIIVFNNYRMYCMKKKVKIFGFFLEGIEHWFQKHEGKLILGKMTFGVKEKSQANIRNLISNKIMKLSMR